jgi:hypothetical protein
MEGTIVSVPPHRATKADPQSSPEPQSLFGSGRRPSPNWPVFLDAISNGSRHGDPWSGRKRRERPPMPPITSADDTLIAAHLACGILAATMRVASVENPAAQAPLAAKLYFDCHDALRAERKLRGLALLIARDVVDPKRAFRCQLHSPVLVSALSNAPFSRAWRPGLLHIRLLPRPRRI